MLSVICHLFGWVGNWVCGIPAVVVFLVMIMRDVGIKRQGLPGKCNVVVFVGSTIEDRGCGTGSNRELRIGCSVIGKHNYTNIISDGIKTVFRRCSDNMLWLLLTSYLGTCGVDTYLSNYLISY